jgi:choice-of-anchor A domain-containing protein
MKRANEKGMAMILTLIMLAVLAAMAVSFMFLSQAETWSTMNYRFMNQARDAAEAGVNVAANHILYSYTPPATAGGDPIGAYDLTTRPVTAGGGRVVLSANSDVTPNYPAAAVQAAFSTAAQGSLTSGSATVNYQTTATLLAMRQVTPYGNTCPNGTPAPCTIQTWLIAGDGRINGIRNAQVQVESVLERPVTPTFGYAAFGTSEICAPEGLDFGGGGTTNSYDSTTFIPGVTPFDNYGGNVGTNGNLTLGGASTTINGNLSTPRTGVGSCASGAAETISGGASLNGSVIGLPQTISFPPPAAPIPTPPVTNDGISNNGQCNATAGCSVNVLPAPADYTLVPTCLTTTGNCTAVDAPAYGNLSLGGGRIFHLTAGTYIMNSLTLVGNAVLVIDSGPVILNVAGQGIGPNQYVVDFNGGSLTNATLNPLNFQILYAGTSDIRLRGGAAAAGTVYAPNADITLGGGGDFYGSLIGYSVEVSGDTALHYDRNLSNTAYTIGNYILSSFTWRKF